MMKRFLISALTLALVFGAGVWGVNYRLNHPPLSQADEQFRALVSGADSVEAWQMSCQQHECFSTMLLKYKPLNAAQTRELIENLRFSDTFPAAGTPRDGVSLTLEFKRQKKVLANFGLFQTLRSSVLSHFGPDGFIMGEAIGENYKLHPRFEKPLRRFLNEVWPTHLKP